jgi:hypothetical protein
MTTIYDIGGVLLLIFIVGLIWGMTRPASHDHHD